MAIINCPECKKEMSSAANACPHCGFAKRKPTQYGCGTIILIGVTGLILYSLFKPNTPPPPATPKTPEQIRAEKVANIFYMGHAIRCENWIKTHLKDPDSFKTVETKYVDNGDHFVVNVKYLAKNSFNGFVVNTGTCKLSLDNVVLEGLPSLEN